MVATSLFGGMGLSRQAGLVKEFGNLISLIGRSRLPTQRELPAGLLQLRVYSKLWPQEPVACEIRSADWVANSSDQLKSAIGWET